MNVLFFCHDDFACNSMGHIAGFAAGLRALGHACAAAIPGDDRASVKALGTDLPFRPVLFSDTWDRRGELFPDSQPADILHAWTPREHVRRAVELCRRGMPDARLVVHLEDNEEHLSARFADETPERLREFPDALLAARLPMHLAHPREAPRFLRTADGVTGIVEALAKFSPPGVPFAELWPGVDFALYHPGPPDPALRASLGVRAEEKILCYPGSSHFANGVEIANLYEAVFALNRRGTPCRLIRTGRDTPDFVRRFEPGGLAEHVLHLGFLDRDRLPGLLRLADVLVQPGEDDAFNRYRLPSKLPEFLASGRPVLLPRANIGLRVQPGREALLLATGQPDEIAAQCRRVFDDPALARRLGEGGAAFARRHFDPAVQARGLADFYRKLRSPWRGALSRLKTLSTSLTRTPAAIRKPVRPVGQTPGEQLEEGGRLDARPD